MKHPIGKYLVGCWFSLPMQLFLLHFKKYQVLLILWYILFATVDGAFMNRFGAHMLFLYPEYLGEVNWLSTFFVGCGVGIFVMCWNITTFILHSRQFKFLAATTQPFLKYCINNGILPLVFLIFYMVSAVGFMHQQELLPLGTILLLIGGFLFGFSFIVAIALFYFFKADKTIYNRLSPQAKQSLSVKHHRLQNFRKRNLPRIRIDWYITGSFKLRKPRNVSHYDTEFLDRIFSQHHLASIFLVLFVFVSLIISGFFQDSMYLQLPSAGSIMVFFAILIAVAGGFTYFLRTWALLVVMLLFLGLNWLYQQNILDPRNKAYGLLYGSAHSPAYTEDALQKASSPSALHQDSLHFIGMLNNWKKRQPNDKPVFVVVAASGGGSRASTFTMNVLQQIDSLTGNGFMPSVFLLTGASGGMMGAAWYREVYWRRQKGIIDGKEEEKYAAAMSKDLLNPIFSSFVTRDLLSPAQFFNYNGKRYIKDRGYAFEQKLDRNTFGWLNKTIDSYSAAEASGEIPHLLLSAVITRDGRKLYISNHPVRFLTIPQLSNNTSRITHPDGIDFKTFFAAQQPGQLRFLSALRMNATFPYILPNVWLPTSPVVDVMDAGFRDNTGLESANRLLHYFINWLQQNCSKVVLVQIRDKKEGGWESPYESNNIFDLVTKPALLTQNNLFRFQEYDQLKQWQLLEQQFGPLLKRIVFEYSPTKKQDAASLSFHLTQREKKDIDHSLLQPQNVASLQMISEMLNH